MGLSESSRKISCEQNLSSQVRRRLDDLKCCSCCRRPPDGLLSGSSAAIGATRAAGPLSAAWVFCAASFADSSVFSGCTGTAPPDLGGAQPERRPALCCALILPSARAESSAYEHMQDLPAGAPALSTPAQASPRAHSKRLPFQNPSSLFDLRSLCALHVLASFHRCDVKLGHTTSAPPFHTVLLVSPYLGIPTTQ